MNIRSAGPTDVDVLVRFNAALASETEDRQLDLDLLRAGVETLLADGAKGRYLIAERAGEVLGALAVTTEWSDWRNGWFWWVQSVYVDASARRQGVYSALYEAVLRDAKNDPKVCGVRLYVERENDRARQTYAQMGMQETAYRLYEVDFRQSAGS